MEIKGGFTTIPDEWWGLIGKYPIIDKETGEVLKDRNGKDRSARISHWTVALLAKIANFNSIRKTNNGITPGKCVASNGYLANLLNVSISTIKNTLSDMYALGILTSYEQKSGQMTAQRFLYINRDMIENILAQKRQLCETDSVKMFPSNTSSEYLSKQMLGETDYQQDTSYSTGVLPSEGLYSPLGSTEQSLVQYPYKKENTSDSKINSKGFVEVGTSSQLVGLEDLFSEEDDKNTTNTMETNSTEVGFDDNSGEKSFFSIEEAESVINNFCMRSNQVHLIDEMYSAIKRNADGVFGMGIYKSTLDKVINDVIYDAIQAG